MTVPTNNEEREALAKALYVAKRVRAGIAGSLTWEQEPDWKREEFLVIADDALAALAARRLPVSGDNEAAIEAGYQAVHDSGALTEDVYRNAAIWHAVDPAIRAALSASRPCEVDVSDEHETHRDAMRDIEVEAIRLYTERMWRDLPEKVKANYRLAAAALGGGE